MQYMKPQPKPEAIKALYNNWQQAEEELAEARKKISSLKEGIRLLKARLIATEIQISNIHGD